MKSVISDVELSKSELENAFKEELSTNQVAKVSTKAIYHFPSNGNKRIVIVDFGYKKNILESLIKRNCDVIVVPYDTTYEKIVSLNPKGILLSNGPGDPKSILEVIPTVQKLQQEYPILAICMGHQIFALANNADTEKMKFGHRGGNHPVQDLSNKRVYITAQNHGYCVNEASIAKTELEITQVNLNDKTIEGLKHKSLPCFSIQYHPEASPGPNDTKYLFDSFLKILGDK
jgi:carbamoyl-phosphate synthase small subunit